MDVAPWTADKADADRFGAGTREGVVVAGAWRDHSCGGEGCGENEGENDEDPWLRHDRACATIWIFFVFFQIVEFIGLEVDGVDECGSRCGK